jgi:hypothetical protein
MAQTMWLMDSFSQRERFIWHNNAFNIIIPNGTRTAYHPRASLSYLKELLIPQIRLTRGGNISQYQPAPPVEQPYDFYLAQLVHYGLDFHFKIEAAQRALEIEIRLERLRVPPGLLKLEKELRREHERLQRSTVVQATAFPAQHKRDSNFHATTSVDTPKHKYKDHTIRRTSPLKSEKRKKQKLPKCSPDASDAHPFKGEVLNGVEADSGEESDTIAVAADIPENASSTRSNSSSSDAVKEVKYSDPTSSSSGNDETAERVDVEEDSSSDDPFVDRHDFKRIKLEKADEHDDSVFRSARDVAPFVTRKQPPPSQVKVRHIASHPQVTVPLTSSTIKGSLGNPGARTDTAVSSKTPVRKPFVSPDKRPSWTIPVRSPSSVQNETPKSVTFSQVQRETPTKVLDAEKASFSSVLKISEDSPHRRTPSSSSTHSQIAPLRSILKKANASPLQPPAALNSKRTEISVGIPGREVSVASRRRRRKRKSDADRGLGLDLDGAHDAFNVVENTHVEKPFITSDIVNGKPMPQKNITSVQASQPPSHHDAETARSGGGFLAINSKIYQQGQQRAKNAGNKATERGQTGKFTSAAELRVEHPSRRNVPVTVRLNQVDTSANRSLKIGASLGKDSLGKVQHMGSRARGSLVKAGRIY